MPPSERSIGADGPAPAAAADEPPDAPSDGGGFLSGMISDEPKLKLPSFDSYSRGPPKPPPPASAGLLGSYKSKLPSINEGSKYEAEPEEEKPLFEKLVFRITYVGLAVLVLIEIFINSPAFQAVKPVILRFTEGE